MKQSLIIIILLASFACGSTSKIQKSYIGKPLTELEAELGKAKTVFDKKDGKMYIFEEVEELKSTEISQHKLTLDPMVSPKAIKTSRYYVTVVDGIIKNIKLEEEYERK